MKRKEINITLDKMDFTIILLINIFWEKMPEKWMTKD
jgi:hypothetical protein